MTQELTKYSPGHTAEHWKKADATANDIVRDSFLNTVDNHPSGFAFGSLFVAIMAGSTSVVALPFAFIDSLELGFALSAVSGATIWQSLNLYAISLALESPYSGRSKRGKKLIRKTVLRRSNKLDRKYGWRPRRGVLHPKGRTDTYPRFLLDVQGSNNNYTLSISRWNYNVDSGWHSVNGSCARESAASETEMLEKYAQMSQQAIELNNQSKQRWEEAQGAKETDQAFTAQLNAHKPGV